MLHSLKLSAVSVYILSVALFNSDLPQYFRLLAHYVHVYAQISVWEHLLLLEVVEATDTFEPLSTTMMLELDKVNSTTEPASSRQAPTMEERVA